MKYMVFIILLFAVSALYAQPSDFIILKKKDKTIRSFYAGTQIEFVSTSGAYRNALVTSIVHDTLYLQEFQVQRIPIQLGFYIIDTLGSYRFAYHYNEIGLFGKKQKGFNLSGSGASLLGGGILLTLANGVVFLADRDKFSPALLGASIGLGALGYLLLKAGNKGMVIGKRNYRIEYIRVTGEKK